MKCSIVALIVNTFLLCCVLSVDIESICGPETDGNLIESIHNARRVAGDWLIQRRERHFGWPRDNSAAAVTSLQLANESLSRGSDPSLERELTFKQLHMEILSLLSQSERSFQSGNHHKSRVDRLPYYIMALNATCQNSTDFHGIDLISRLTEDMKRFHKDEVKNYYQHALAVLAMCSTGHPVKRRFIDDLINGQGPDGCFQRPCASDTCGDTSVSIDTTSIILSALSCVSKTEIHRDVEAIETSIEGAVNCLLDHSHQNNGSFGNVINDAMAAQGLLAAEVNHSRWDCHVTMRSVLDAMHEDGHFGGVATTILVLPLLAGRHHRHVKELDVDCPEVYSEISVPDLRDFSSSDEIRIVLQVSTDERNWYYGVSGARGESLLDLMYREQEDSDGEFTFETKTTDWGEYITSINGVDNDDGTGRHWLIQRMEGQELQCIDKGAADIYPGHYERYVWTHRMCGTESNEPEEDVDVNDGDANTEENEFITNE